MPKSPLRPLRGPIALHYNSAAGRRRMTAPVNTRLVIGPNASLTPRQAAGFMALVAVPGLGIAGVFAAQGFWPIFPFAGLELSALGAALWVSLRRNRYREVLRFEGGQLAVEFGSLGSGVERRLIWPRTWTRAVLEPGRRGNDPQRLLLMYAGRRVEIGRCLTDDERAALRERIKELLKPALPEGAAGAVGRGPEPSTQDLCSGE
jgi:uncharacterized membrane protein